MHIYIYVYIIYKECLYMYVYIYIYIRNIYFYIYTYIYIYILSSANGRRARSLRLLAEEARRLLDRTARETELRSAARACLQEATARPAARVFVVGWACGSGKDWIGG